MYTLTIKLKQHTPLIHFQHEQAGATLRATEVKPKLDRFLVEKLGGIDEARKKHPEWFASDKHDALDYKVRIVASKDEDETYRLRMREDESAPADKRWKVNDEDSRKFPMILANMAGKPSKEELKNLRMFKTIDCSLFCYEISLYKYIEENIPLFFASHNFGNRNNKGYGSFTVESINKKTINFDHILLGAGVFYLDIPTSNVRQVLLSIDYFYKWLKSGINYSYFNGSCQPGRYKKSLLFEYLDSITSPPPVKYSWEKRWLKENYFTLTASPNNPKFARALMGLSPLTTFTYPRCHRGPDVPKDQNGKEIHNAHLGLEIERIKSPLTFKPVMLNNRTYVYIIIDHKNVNGIYRHIPTLTFMFAENSEKLELNYTIMNNRYDVRYKLGQPLTELDDHLNRLRGNTALKSVFNKIDSYKSSIKFLDLPPSALDYNAFLTFVRSRYPNFVPKRFDWSDIIKGNPSAITIGLT